MTVRNPQLFHEVEVSEIQRFIDDPEWVLEQKVDGMRCMTVVDESGVTFYTRGGKLLNSSAAKLHFDAIRDEFDNLLRFVRTQHSEVVLDGELVTESGQLVLLDMPYSTLLAHRALPEHRFEDRRDAMMRLWRERLTMSRKVVPVLHAATAPRKAQLVATVARQNLEGCIAKRLDSEYTEGKRVKHSLKLKFTSTADVVITGKNVGESKHSIRGGDKINYTFGVYAPDETADEGYPWVIQHMGTCSGIGKESVEVGDVIEVEYLYVGAGGKLTQPRMVKPRPDKPAAECTLDQFSAYSKAVL